MQTAVKNVYPQSWLAADFQKERERHRANAKRICKAVEVFHKTKESKKVKKAKVIMR